MESTITLSSMFFGADPIVKGVMLLLALASLVCWVIIFEKIIILRKLSGEVRVFCSAVFYNGNAPDHTASTMPPLFQDVAARGERESRDVNGVESRADYRERIERSMREAFLQTIQPASRNVRLLATVGSSSPFIGLFGTVWGIMHSFINIAASGETSLAVVAPGIAEALLATAMGLVAAIPAVIAFNQITASSKKVYQNALFGISALGNRLAASKKSVATA